MRVEDGIITTEAHKGDWEESEYTSTRLVTRGKAQWTYGRFEVKAKLPAGLGNWPAIWMVPVDWNVGSGKWPDVGEIYIMEHVSYDEGIVHDSAHAKVYQWQICIQNTATLLVSDATSEFHTYALECDSHSMRVFVDEEQYFEYENAGNGWGNWPYQRDYYLILNLAGGGAWGEAKGFDETIYPKRLQVDFVRVYEKIQEHEE